MFDAGYFISALNLEPHVEGGYFREIYRSPQKIDGKGLMWSVEGERPLVTTIYFLLKSGQVSKFHRLKSDEIWFYHYGPPLIIHMIDPQGNLISRRLGLDIQKLESPQLLVPANTVFGAEVAEDNSFSLVSCMVSPGFDYGDFELFKSSELVRLYPDHKNLIERFNGT